MLKVPILTVLFLIGCWWLAGASLPSSLSAEQPGLTVIVSSAQLALLQPIWKEAGSHYYNNEIQ
jgi:hypothetical protein